MTERELARLARGALLAGFAGAEPPHWLLEELDHGLGGVTMFAVNGNVPDVDGLAALTARLREVAEPVVAIDEEGGDVTRLAHRTGSPYPGNAALGAVDDPDLTRRVYRSLGVELVEVGVTMDFAPSVDVNSAADNPIIGTRSFGADPELVARHAAAAVTGLQEVGIAACAKHFPGHGATVEDSHLGLPVVDADLELLSRRELVPFRAAIAAGTRAVMTAHLNVPALTGGAPATLSPAAITGLLREDLDYSGVVVTDALDMHGASGELGIPEAAVRALAAGADLLCLGRREEAASIRAVVAAVLSAVRAGRLSAARLAASAARVQALKSRPHNGFAAQVDPLVGLDAARRAILVPNPDVLPDDLVEPLVVELDAPANIAIGPVPWGLRPWVPAPDLLRVDPATVRAETILARATGRSLVLVVRDAHRYPAQRVLVTAVLAARPDAVLVELGLPIWRPPHPRYLASFGATAANSRAVADRLGLTRLPSSTGTGR